jgi:hypothetical protein
MFDLPWADKHERRRNIKDHVWRFLLFPTFWEDPLKKLPSGLVWNEILFQEDNADKIPSKNGVYCFVVTPPANIGLFETKYLFYVGKASGTKLRVRYKNYINEMNNVGIGEQKPRIKVQEMLNQWYGHIYFYYTVLDDQKNVIDHENILLNTFMPYVNTSIPELQISEEYRHIY